MFCFQDFGDYQDGYYSVQTTEGEQIAQLIAGYIDIILKKVTNMIHYNGKMLWFIIVSASVSVSEKEKLTFSLLQVT